MPPVTACTPSNEPVATLQAFVGQQQCGLHPLGIVGAGGQQAQRQGGLRIVRLGLQARERQLLEFRVALGLQQRVPLWIGKGLRARVDSPDAGDNRGGTAQKNNHSRLPF
jgi:hypothetical protein